MPSLMPGVAGAKEVYGISMVGEDRVVNVPPKALERYGYRDRDQAVLVTGHRGESGFGLVRRETGGTSVFSRTWRSTICTSTSWTATTFRT